jgi:hypothetical protein
MWDAIDFTDNQGYHGDPIPPPLDMDHIILLNTFHQCPGMCQGYGHRISHDPPAINYFDTVNPFCCPVRIREIMLTICISGEYRNIDVVLLQFFAKCTDGVYRPTINYCGFVAGYDYEDLQVFPIQPNVNSD